MVCACNPSTEEVEAGGFLGTSWPILISEIQTREACLSKWWKA